MQTKFELALSVLTEHFLSDLPPITDTEFSKKFKRRMQKLIKRWEKPYYILINTAAKRVACIIVGIIIAVTALTMSARALLPDVWNIFTTWFDEYMSVGFNSEAASDSGSIEEIMVPKYLPEGLEISDTIKTPTTYTTLFTRNEELVCEFIQYVYKVPLLYDDDSPLRNVKVLQYDSIISTINYRHCLAWEDGKYYYVITDYDSSLSDGELIAIAESIYE